MTRRFTTATGWLEWLPSTPEREGWPLASLASRASIAYEVELARAEHQVQCRRAEELQRQRSELQLLIFSLLGERVDASAIILVSGQTETDVGAIQLLHSNRIP